MRSMLAYPHLPDLEDIIKVAAHVVVTEDMDAMTRWLARGNDQADEDAKAGVDCHEPFPAEAARAVLALVARIESVLGVISATLRHWPFLPGSMQRMPRGVRIPKAPRTTKRREICGRPRVQVGSGVAFVGVWSAWLAKHTKMTVAPYVPASLGSWTEFALFIAIARKWCFVAVPHWCSAPGADVGGQSVRLACCNLAVGMLVSGTALICGALLVDCILNVLWLLMRPCAGVLLTNSTNSLPLVPVRRLPQAQGPLRTAATGEEYAMHVTHSTSPCLSGGVSVAPRQTSTRQTELLRSGLCPSQ